MTDTIPDSRPSFPWWIVGGAVLLAAAYLPTLAMPFDFLDDGNLVYPTRGLSFTGHVAQWWEKVAANVNHLGPWRPVLWAHWEILSNLCDESVLAWRIERLTWCAFAAGLFLWLLKELKVHPIAALVAGAIGMWNPYRNEVWLSLTLAEGVAMPYAFFALIAARRASSASRPLAWEIAAVVSVLMALGCKNTFAALVPAQIVLRMWPDSLTLREAWRVNGRRALLLMATLVVPIGHFIYFTMNWHEGQYRPVGITTDQTLRLLSALRGSIGLDFLGAGFVLAALAVWAGWKASAVPELLGELRAAILTGVVLLGFGFAAYLPLDIISGRYTMPAVWGLDILVGVLLTALLRVAPCFGSRIAWFAIAIGLCGLMIAVIGKQEKATARANVLWDAVYYVEQNAAPGTRVAWVGGDRAAGELDVEEGIHFRWHLMHRGRLDVTVGLYSTDGQPVERVELKPLDGEPDLRIANQPAPADWVLAQSFRRDYRRGHRHFTFGLEHRSFTSSAPSSPGPSP